MTILQFLLLEGGALKAPPLRRVNDDPVIWIHDHGAMVPGCRIMITGPAQEVFHGLAQD